MLVYLSYNCYNCCVTAIAETPPARLVFEGGRPGRSSPFEGGSRGVPGRGTSPMRGGDVSMLAYSFILYIYIY